MSALDKKISALTEATTLSVGDFFAVVQAGETKKVNFSNLFSNQNETLANIQTAITNGTLVSGSVYFLTDVQTTLAETITAKVLIQAVSNNKINPNAIRFQLVADYDALPIWSSGGTYNIGDKVIWGSRVWENLNGNVGTATDIITLNNEWDEVPYVAGTDYTEVAIPCIYDIVSDVIICQEYEGLKVCTSPDFIAATSFSACDYCDWGQLKEMDACLNNTLYVFPLLNNPNLVNFYSVDAFGVTNNLCTEISNCNVKSSKIYSQTGDGAIHANECDIIRNVTNLDVIREIPAAVNEYSWVTDDESGYIELDLDNNPLNIGTHVIGCILPIDVALCEVTMNCDGGLPPTTDFTFGIDTDDATHVTFTGSSINTSPQRDTTISARTSAFARELVLDIATADADSGKLWITYKYI